MREPFKTYTVVFCILMGSYFFPVLASADYTVTTGDADATNVAAGSSSNYLTGTDFDTIGAGTIQTGWVKMNINSGAPTNFVVRLYASDGSNPTGSPIAEDATNHTNATSCAQEGATVNFDFGSPVSVDATTEYWIVVGIVGGDGSNFYNSCRGNAGNTSTTGSTNTNWSTGLTANDISFEVSVVEVGGGGGGAGTTTLSTVDTAINVIFYGILVYFLSMAMVIWIFKRV